MNDEWWLFFLIQTEYMLARHRFMVYSCMHGVTTCDLGIVHDHDPIHAFFAFTLSTIVCFFFQNKNLTFLVFTFALLSRAYSWVKRVQSNSAIFLAVYGLCLCGFIPFLPGWIELMIYTYKTEDSLFFYSWLYMVNYLSIPLSFFFFFFYAEQCHNTIISSLSILVLSLHDGVQTYPPPPPSPLPLHSLTSMNGPTAFPSLPSLAEEPWYDTDTDTNTLNISHVLSSYRSRPSTSTNQGAFTPQ